MAICFGELTKGVTLTSIGITRRGITVIHAETTRGTKITYMWRGAEAEEMAGLRRIVDEANAPPPPAVEWTST